jgi:hypothetical protein
MSGFFPQSLSNGIIPQTISQANQQDLISFTGSNQVESARYINPLTQDFELNSNGQFLGMNATDQSVYLALLTTFNSSSVSGLGQTFGSVPVIGTNINLQMQNILNQCLSALVQNNLIVIQSVSVTQPGQNTMSVSFTYFNQSLGSAVTTNFTLNNGILV